MLRVSCRVVAQAWTRRGRALLQVHKYQAAAEALQQALRYATEADNRRKLEHWLEQATQGTCRRCHTRR